MPLITLLAGDKDSRAKRAVSEVAYKNLLFWLASSRVDRLRSARKNDEVCEIVWREIQYSHNVRGQKLPNSEY